MHGLVQHWRGADLHLLLLGISGFDYARRRSSLPISLAYLLIEFAIGMGINRLAWEGSLPLILLPLAAQAVVLLPRVLAGGMCLLVIAGVSGSLSWVPAWPNWLRNIAQATAAVVFVVVYVGVAERERKARQRAEALAAEVAQLAAANERNRMAREIHDTLRHYLTVIHVQLEAARAVIGGDPERGMLAVTRAQALAKDGLTAVRHSVKALREEGSVDSIAEQIASLVESVCDERFSVALTISGTPRPVSAAVALALHRTTLEALTNVRKHAAAAKVEIELAFRDNGLVQLRVHDDGKGAVEETVGTGFGLQAVALVEQLRPSVVLMDLCMSKVDGPARASASPPETTDAGGARCRRTPKECRSTSARRSTNTTRSAIASSRRSPRS